MDVFTHIKERLEHPSAGCSVVDHLLRAEKQNVRQHQHQLLTWK